MDKPSWQWEEGRHSPEYLSSPTTLYVSLVCRRVLLKWLDGQQLMAINLQNMIEQLILARMSFGTKSLLCLEAWCALDL